MKTILEVSDIWVRYGLLDAVRGVSFQVEEGSVVSLLGANGAGKSTVLKCISGLHPASSGTIFFLGRMLNGVPPQRIVAMGMAQVPEGRRVFSFMSVEENLLVGAHVRGRDERIGWDLEGIYQWFPVLRERRRQKAGSLSGGEQQMLVIGRALMAKPRLLLLDEPSLGLSPLMVQEIASIIRKIHRQGVSVLLVEQNAKMALRLSQRACVLQNGRVILYGDSKEIASHDFVRKAYLGG